MTCDFHFLFDLTLCLTMSVFITFGKSHINSRDRQDQNLSNVQFASWTLRLHNLSKSIHVTGERSKIQSRNCLTSKGPLQTGTLNLLLAMKRMTANLT